MAKKRKAPARSPKPKRARAGDDDRTVKELLHEPHVHSEELTVQNEQLVRAQHDIEQARDRYADLFDFAPIGYLTLTLQGVITSVNIAAAMLLGRERAF